LIGAHPYTVPVQTPRRLPDLQIRLTPRALRAVAVAAVLVVASLVASAIHGEVVSTPHVRAELLLEKPSVAPGESFDVALRLRMKDGWHTYWRHPGDSGEPTDISWNLPPGFTAGDIQWPYPQKISMAPLATYGYEGEAMLLVPFKTASDAKPGTTARVTADVYWMVCETVCIPEEVTLALDVSIAKDSVVPSEPAASAFASTRAKLPIPADDWKIAASEHDGQFVLRIEPPHGVALDGVHAGNIQFFAASGPLIEHSAPQTTSVDGRVVTMRLVRSPHLTGTPERLNGILLAANGVRGGGAAAIEFDVPFTPPSAAAAAATAATATTAVPPTLLVALALAFIGGVILNLMPCVFPVISLKILAFVQSAGDDPRRVRAHGLTFASGVLVSFWALAALLLALRAAGEEIGWGFQLQSPGFVAAMAFLLFGLGLSLAGVVEIGTSFTRLGGAGTGAASSGHRASFMNGVLATIVATPCTAPFMGAALGFAMTRSAVTSMLIFTALGAGMAAPYVALSAWPALLRFLPRPGQWMVRFRQVMAFPLFATVAWLAWVFGHQTGIDGVLRLLLGLTLLALGLWIWGEWVTLSAAERTKWAARTAGAGFIVAGLVFAATSAPTATAAPSPGSAGGIAWEIYSEERVAEQRAAGRPVFIDFTAAWCLTCKVNERVAFSSDEVHQLVKARNIAMLKADWTSRDPAITRALAGFGRSGVPLYVLYEADPAAQPRLLPEILSPGILVNAFSEVK
jgi:thiol:disulfide interchange protein/DsbC/DsbD-like thiol-disulfide interchange protein